MDLLDPSLLLPAFAIAAAAGVVKGLTGFAMPMVLISGLSLFLPPELALAGLILPTLVTNGMQALRLGRSAAWATVVRFRLFLAALLAFLLLSSQLVSVLSSRALFLLIGGPITLFAALQLCGWSPVISGRSRPLELAVGAFSGFVGGLSGVWGPPTVAYLSAIDLPKAAHVQAQGVIYGVGAVALLAAHVRSGVVSAATLPFSAALVVPAILGTLAGQTIHDRIDHGQFRTLVRAVLLVAGLNLIRRGLTG